jgi:glutathione S-transferase
MPANDLVHPIQRPIVAPRQVDLALRAVGGCRLGHPGDIMLVIYGWKRSRAIRCMWVMEELGLKYEHVPLNPQAGETRTAEYLKLNPSGKIPTLVHDGFVLTESMAINAYLARTHAGTLWPRDPHGVARTEQWTSWALSELEPCVVSILRETRRPPEQIDASRIQGWREEAAKLVGQILEPQLARNPYLLPGNDFTLVDLNVSSVVSTLPLFQIPLDPYPGVAGWLHRCLDRPAWKRLQSV